MKISQNLSLFEKAFTFIFLFLFIVFSIFFTLTNIREIESDYTKQRIEFTKKISRQIHHLIENRNDVSSTLSNILAENSVLYAIVHFSDGSLLARSENYALPVGIFEVAEAKALKTEYLTFTSFKDPSGRISIKESAIPIYTNDRAKYILRLGFLKDEEEDKISHLKLRNILIFSIIFVLFLSIKFIKHIDIFNMQYALLGLMSSIMLILFFTSSFFIRNWFNSSWRDKFVSMECINQTKMLIPNTLNFIDNKNLGDFEKAIKILKNNNDFESLSVIKDDLYIYHLDSSRIGQRVSNDYYQKSLNTNNPSVFKHDNTENYTALIPVLEGNNRVGTLCTTWNNIDGYKTLSSLRRRLSTVFVFAYILLYIFLYVFTDEVTKRLSTVYKIKDSNINIIKKVENSTTYDIKNNNNAAVSVFIYFSGIVEAIKKINQSLLLRSINDCYDLVKNILKNNEASYVELRSDGILVVFQDEIEQNSIYNAIIFANNYNESLSSLDYIAFTPKITINSCNLICFQNKDSNSLIIGDCLIEYKTIARIQSNNEIIASKYFYERIKDIFDFENVEVLSNESAKFNCYILLDKKSTKDLIETIANSSDWTKLMILRILKSNSNFDSNTYNDIIEKYCSNLKESILKFK